MIKKAKTQLNKGYLVARYNKFAFFLLLFLCVFVSAIIYIISAKTESQYVRGVYSKYCYEMGNYPRQIKELLYFDTLEDCKISIIKK